MFIIIAIYFTREVGMRYSSQRKQQVYKPTRRLQPYQCARRSCVYTILDVVLSCLLMVVGTDVCVYCIRVQQFLCVFSESISMKFLDNIISACQHCLCNI